MPVGAHVRVQLPLDDFDVELDQTAAHIINTYHMPDYYYDDVREKLRVFVIDADRAREQQLGDAAIDAFLQRGTGLDELDANVTSVFGRLDECELEDPLRNHFCAILDGHSQSRIRALLLAQETFTRQVRSVCRERDVHINRLTQQ